jgi:predicted hotdog family 3-hydroxylacyl-ACP dehydratase
LDRIWIERHIPHRGRMMLLDEVLEWDARRARCRSTTHRAPDHPLRARGRLGAASGIEYAAQTMAVHGALCAGAGAPRPEAGFLASLRGVRFRVPRLDDITGDLESSVTLVASDGATALYDFELRSDARPLASGRASVVFDASKRWQP